jgi:pimeloyl-ACP methyl ester carboxylesterase
MTDTTTGAPVAEHRIAMPGGEVQLLRGGDGPPLLLLHGGGGSDWGPLHEALAEHFDVLAPHHPGMGRSDDFDAFQGVDDLVFHYDDLLDVMSLASVTVVGLAFGGWLGAELAVLSPGRVEQLVLVAPLGLRIPEHPVTDIFLMSPEQRLAAAFHDVTRAPAVPEGLDIDAFMENFRDQTALARFAWMPFMSNPKLESRLHRVRARTLVVAAAEDAVIPRAHPERYAERIAGARLEVVDDVGHVLLVERPQAVVDVVTSFLVA